jgi:hypothetical protein
MESRGIHPFRAGSAGAIAVRNDDGVSSDGSFHPAKQKIVSPAARGQQEPGGTERDSPDSHATHRKSLCYSKSTPIRPLTHETSLIKNPLMQRMLS